MKRYLIKISTSALLILLSLSANALVVLQYHHIDEGTPASTSVTPAQFIEHMILIDELGLEVVDLETAARTILNSSDGLSESSKQVAISFDDAYYSIMKYAFPELQRRNWPFTIFVNTQAVNEKNRGIMSWSQIKQLVDAGVTIANHTVSHSHLPSIPKDMSIKQWLDQEVLSAQNELDQRLGKQANMLAYPYGEFTLEMVTWLQARNMIAFGQQSGPIGKFSHPQALPRFPASGIYANSKTLKTKLMSLALPVSSGQLKDPMISTQENPPLLSIQLIEADYSADQLQCFASQQGAIKTRISHTESGVLLTTQATNKLTGKRGRYNCTVSSSQLGRYYWYSQPWQMH